MFACLAALAGGDLSDQEFCQRLPVSILPLIMLFGLHLVHNDLLTFQLLKYLCLDCDIIQIWSATCECAILFGCKYSAKIDGAARFSLRCIVDLQQKDRQAFDVIRCTDTAEPLNFAVKPTWSLLQVYHRPSSSSICVPAASTMAYLAERLTYDGVCLPPSTNAAVSEGRAGASTAKATVLQVSKQTLSHRCAEQLMHRP